MNKLSLNTAYLNSVQLDNTGGPFKRKGVSIPYLENFGKAYINTGFIPNQDTRVVARVQAIVTGDTQWVFGARRSAELNIYSFNVSEQGSYMSTYGNTKSLIDKSYNTDRSFLLDKNKNVTYINGQEVARTNYRSVTPPVSMYLFAMNTNGSITGGKCRIYYLKIYDNDVLVRDFVPMQWEDGRLGFYDKVNMVFYGSVGSDEFNVQSASLARMNNETFNDE